MFLRRVIAIKSAGLDPQDYPTPEGLNAILSEREQAPANCLRNLFEVPVIFYALTAFVAAMAIGDPIFVNMAWAFVGLRSLQACVHCTYNRVMHRFYAYLASSLILWVMVIRFFLIIF
ncbi:MAG: hypothetical protein ACJAYF_000573 [Arenicella sp.]|jgi:hypothetical protein